MTDITVMVTALGGGGGGEQILKALRLADTSYRIIGGDMSPNSRGLSDVDIAYILPPASDDDYVACVLAICRKHGVLALFPGSDPELKRISDDRATFGANGVFLPINPREVIDICMDKAQTARFLTENGFVCPRSVVVRQPADVDSIERLPVVLKPLVGGGSIDVLVAQTRDELRLFAHHLLATYTEFLVQEYVGTPDLEYTVGVLISMDGELINSIAIKRLIESALTSRIRVSNRTGRQELSSVLAISSGVSQGEVGRWAEVTGPCEAVATRLGARGSINLQCRRVGDEMYIFEINPRFSGTTSLRAMVGYNEPDILVRAHVLGERCLPRFEYRPGLIMRGLDETYIGARELLCARSILGGGSHY